MFRQLPVNLCKVSLDRCLVRLQIVAQQKVVAPFVALSLATLAIMPMICVAPAGTCIAAVVDCPYRLPNAVKLSAAVTAPSLVL